MQRDVCTFICLCIHVYMRVQDSCVTAYPSFRCTHVLHTLLGVWGWILLSLVPMVTRNMSVKRLVVPGRERLLRQPQLKPGIGLCVDFISQNQVELS